MQYVMDNLTFNSTKEILDMEVNYVIEKSDVPIVFIDTNFLFDFSRFLQGKATEFDFTETLYKLLLKLALKKKIYIPFSRLIVNELVRGVYDNSKKVVFSLTNTCILKLFLDIEDYLVDVGYKAYLKKLKVVNLNFKIMFNEIDFSTNLAKSFPLDNKYFGCALKKEQEGISKSINKLNELKRLAPTYEERYINNQNSMKDMFGRALFKHQMINQLGFPLMMSNNEVHLIDRALTSLEDKNQPQFNVKQLLDYNHYLASNYYKKLPIVDISSALLSTFLGGEKIDKSFNNDLILTKTYFPFFNIYITERKLSRKIKETKLDEAYDVLVFNVRNVKDLIDKLKLIDEE